MVYKPGESGNPGGRPKATITLVHEFEKRGLILEAIDVMQECLQKRNKDRFVAARWILEKVYGKPVQPLGNEDDKTPFVIKVEGEGGLFDILKHKEPV